MSGSGPKPPGLSRVFVGYWRKIGLSQRGQALPKLTWGTRGIGRDACASCRAREALGALTLALIESLLEHCRSKRTPIVREHLLAVLLLAFRDRSDAAPSRPARRCLAAIRGGRASAGGVRDQ